MSVDSVRVALPLFQTDRGGATPASTLQLVYERCSCEHAIRLNRMWHSRLPVITKSQFRFCDPLFFHARCGDVTYAVAAWSNPVARHLPQYWYELRRLAVSPDAPRFTCSSFLSWMVRWIRKHKPDSERLISYSDCAVHDGTIYRASNWNMAAIRKPDSNWGIRLGKRTRLRLNGNDPVQSQKYRWEIEL